MKKVLYVMLVLTLCGCSAREMYVSKNVYKTCLIKRGVSGCTAEKAAFDADVKTAGLGDDGIKVKIDK